MYSAFSICAIATDVGSTKVSLVRDIKAVWDNDCVYVGSHPMTGSEKRGVEYAHEITIDGMTCVVTPSADTPILAVKRIENMWRTCGFSVQRFSPEMHDRLVAKSSHLPHIVAAALVEGLPPEAEPVVGRGFRDCTRIAMGDPEIWADIVESNKDEISSTLRLLAEELITLSDSIEKSNRSALTSYLERAKVRREALVSAELERANA